MTIPYCEGDSSVAANTRGTLGCFFFLCLCACQYTSADMLPANLRILGIYNKRKVVSEG
jgi:hypothetical protein